MPPRRATPFSRLTSDAEGLPVPRSNDNELVNALMVGAGLSMAIHTGAYSWGDLISQLSLRLGGKKPRTKHWFVEGLRLSRTYSPSRRDAVPTEFQRQVRDLVQNSVQRPDNADPEWVSLCAAFAKFLRTTQCAVILDTNYDPTVEWLLEGAGVRYTRLIGSEAGWICPLPGEAILVWKMHGSVDTPATIVLSPTEYQRIYESNALGPVLQSLGERIDCLWVLGSGLGDDETWPYLCTDTGPRQIACLWQTSDSESPLVPRKWLGIVTRPSRAVTVYWNQYGARAQGRTTTAAQLDAVSTTVAGRAGDVRKSSQASWWDERIKSFDDTYEKMRKSSNVAACLALAQGTQHDFDKLRNYLLSQQGGGMGRTWCATVPSNLVLDAGIRKKLAEDFSRIAQAAVDLYGSRQPGSVMAAAAAQAAVAYVVELAEILNIGVTVLLAPEPEKPSPVGKAQGLLVGANPFFVRSTQAVRANLMHYFETTALLSIQYPIAGQPPSTQATSNSGSPPRSSRATSPDQAPAMLLSEDEWEACVILSYRRRNPQLIFGDCKPVAIQALPPLYPWGFVLKDIQAFRERNTGGTLSRRWHLVSNVEGGWQVCKGGGLRDRGRIAFRIGNRSRVRIGEYDEFLEPAYR